MALATPAPTSAAYGFVTKWGSGGPDTGQFGALYGVAVDSSGNVYAADFGNDRVQKFDSNGGFITQWGSLGSNDNQFTNPWGIATDSSGNVFVGDSGNHFVKKFSSAGGFIHKFGGLGTGPGQFHGPVGVATDSANNVYVTDYHNSGNLNRIQKFSTSSGAASFVTEFGTRGSGDGQFNNPHDVATDSAGNVYVSDWGNHRIQKFAPTSGGGYGYVGQWGSQGSADGQLVYPEGVATDSAGNVYVADRGNNRIQKFNSSGDFITKWGTHGSDDGQFKEPGDVTVDGAGNVYVADGGNDRIQKFFDPDAQPGGGGGGGGGDGGGPPGETPPDPPPQCTDRTTLVVTCADAAGPPGVCGPTGTIFPQCHLPIDLPIVCGPMGTILQACTSQGPYVVACGGFGTILPPCTNPPREVPGICGPSNTLLPPCTGANNPVTVCGPSNTVLAQCSFGGRVNATPLNTVDETGQVEVTVSCPAALATASSTTGPRAARKKVPRRCEIDAAMEPMRAAKVTALQREASARAPRYAHLGRAFAAGGHLPSCPPVPGAECANRGPIVPPLTPLQSRQFGSFNANTFEARARTLVLRYLGRGVRSPQVRGDHEPLSRQVIERFTRRAGTPNYVGPDELLDLYLLDLAPIDFLESLQTAVDDYFTVYRQRAPIISGSVRPAANSSRRLVKRVRVARGKRVRIRIRLSPKLVRGLARDAGSRARYLPLRVVVSVKAKPRPVARFIDIPVRIQRKSTRRR